jgi:hypothetical protein
MEDILLQRQMEMQLDLATQKLTSELKALRDEMKGLRDDVTAISKVLRNPSNGGTIPSSPPSRGEFQVSSPNHVAPSGQDPYHQGFGNEGYAHNQFQQPQYQAPQQQFAPQQQQLQPAQIDQSQGGFTGAQMAQTSRGRGTSLPPNLAMDKVFYCGGKK